MYLPIDDPLTKTLSFIFNRLSFGFYFTAFSLVSFYWAEIYHKSYYDSSTFLPSLGIFFIITNVALWILRLGVVLVYLITGIEDFTKEGNIFYEISIWTDNILSLMVAITLLTYGIATFIKARSESPEDRHLYAECVKLILITLAFVGSFSLRVMAFSYRYITFTYMDNFYYMPIAYYLPDLIPTILQVIVVETSKGKENETTTFIKNLYSDDDDSLNTSRDNISKENAKIHGSYRNSYDDRLFKNFKHST